MSVCALLCPMPPCTVIYFSQFLSEILPWEDSFTISLLDSNLPSREDTGRSSFSKRLKIMRIYQSDSGKEMIEVTWVKVGLFQLLPPQQNISFLFVIAVLNTNNQ